jgi:hypothetical protein
MVCGHVATLMPGIKDDGCNFVNIADYPRLRAFPWFSLDRSLPTLRNGNSGS